MERQQLHPIHSIQFGMDELRNNRIRPIQQLACFIRIRGRVPFREGRRKTKAAGTRNRINCGLVILIEEGDGFHAGEELLEEVALVRRMDGVALETEAHEERVYSENLLHVGEDSDAAAAA